MFIGWKSASLHILTTSRREAEIAETLNSLITDQICIQNIIANADIQVHIRETLQTDEKSAKWPPNVHIEIEKTLVEGARGMYV